MQNHRASFRFIVAAILAALASLAAQAANNGTAEAGKRAPPAANAAARTAANAGASTAANAAATAALAGQPALPVAQLNGKPLYGLTLDVMHHILQQKDPGFTRAATLELLVGNRLLAAQVKSRFGRYDLGANRRVAFDPAVASEDQLVASLRQQFDALNAPVDDKTLQALQVEFVLPETRSWDEVFGVPGKLLLDYSLNPAQMDEAKKIVLMHSKLAGAESISLFDVVRRLNVQGRVEFFNRNFDFVQQQARQRLGSVLVLNWANRFYGTGAVNDLRTAFAEREQARAVMALHGIASDIDGDSALLSELAARVSATEIKTYYHAHKAEFARIERVKARHIRLPDEAAAQKVSAQLANGEDFSRLAQQVSIAPDAKQGGDLGWVRQDGTGSWLTDLAFTQAAGQVSPPFRSPVGPNEAAVWEILKVEQREDGFQSPDSESVRHTASRAVAAQKALAQITALKQQLRQRAKLQVFDPGLVVAAK